MATERKKVTTYSVLSDGTMSFTVIGGGSLVFDPSKCTEETRRSAQYFGFGQTLIDRAALSKDTKTGASPSPKDKFERLKRRADWLEGGGTWEMARGPAPLNRAALFAALSEVFIGRAVAQGKDPSRYSPEAVEGKFRDQADEVLRTYLTAADVAAAYARLTASGRVEVDGLLEDWEGEEGDGSTE